MSESKTVDIHNGRFVCPGCGSWAMLFNKDSAPNNYCGKNLGVEDVCTIFGSFWDKHLNRWIHGRMPATKEIKYLKNHRIE